MGVGMSRLNAASCGAFRRTTSELQDPSTYTRMMVDRDDHNNSKIIPSQGQKNNSSVPKDVTVSSSLPKQDVVNEEKNVNVNKIYQQLDEESEKSTDYDGPMFMKSPSFRDFMRPVEPRRGDSVKNGGKKEGEMRETNKTEAHYDYICTEEACIRVETKNDAPVMNKEAGPGKDKKIHKILSQYYKPSTVGGGMKNLFNPQPKHPKPSN